MLVAGQNLIELLADCLSLKRGLGFEPPPKVLIHTADVGRTTGGTLRNH